jgi:hypothetical protein
MTVIEILQSAEQSGILKSMLAKGLISPQVIGQREIYYKILTYLEDRNNPKMSLSKAIAFTCDDLDITDSRAWRAWSAMTK